jgi:hypothetical protein
MATEQQISANRANAKRSTGPKTEKGRDASSRNAVRHGLSCSSQPSAPIDIDGLAEALVQSGSDETQAIAARQTARAHIELLRVRAVRVAMLASFNPRGDAGILRRLFTLERYERVARGKRRLATRALLSE